VSFSIYYLKSSEEEPMRSRGEDDEHRTSPKHKKGRRGSIERMISGLVFGLGFGALAILRPDFAWAGFVAIFAGALPSIVAKGHALMQIREDGRMEYEFREFMSLPKA
jgi:hypothetical protein